MAETDRDDMTEHDREALRDATPAREGHAGPDAPVHPDPDNPDQPSGATPPGGPAKAMADHLADERAEAAAVDEEERGRAER